MDEDMDVDPLTIDEKPLDEDLATMATTGALPPIPASLLSGFGERHSSEFEDFDEMMPSPPTPPSSAGGQGRGGNSSASLQKRLGRKRITEFIADKQLRLKSYVRRRHVPFKRSVELDTACNTTSLLIQFCPDFDECLYQGPMVLVDKFLSKEGLKFTDCDDAVKNGELREE